MMFYSFITSFIIINHLFLVEKFYGSLKIGAYEIKCVVHSFESR